MSFAKRQLEHQWACHGAGQEICVRAGILNRCDMCDEVTTNYGDVTDAYKLGNYLFTQHDEVIALFRDRREMTDSIRSAFDDAGMECFCERQFAKLANDD